MSVYIYAYGLHKHGGEAGTQAMQVNIVAGGRGFDIAGGLPNMHIVLYIYREYLNDT